MPSTAESPELEEVNVLAVDDVAENLIALRALLRRPGIRLIEARSGREALEALLVHDIALALLDVNMPEMDGFELAELMRGSGRTQSVPIIFLTAALPDGARMFQGYEAGAVDFLFKPFHPYLLVGKVEVFAQLHRQKRKLASQLEQIRQAQNMSDLFLGVLGHDLRNPLGNVVTTAYLLEKTPDDPVVVQKRARLIQSASFRMQRLIQHVLDFALSRVKGGIPVTRAETDLAELARQLIAELDPAASSRLELEVTGDSRSLLDPDRMTQVLSNLVGNALEHGSEGARVGLVIDGSDSAKLVLRVQNAGVIPAATLPELFSPFKSRDRGTQGVGLGLYIVDQIVKAHGGTIGVDSAEARGTRFEIVLPRAPDGAGPVGRSAGAR
jgi:two-component system, sensor histidine kinase and response regulator